ncbi:hypothetical protein C723_2681 [Christiangramia flava JLT2011]|uniref:Uncharacterized protein n=2 Tax=Christiangramia TaxID=292691 RepID=A0A1L7HZN5_9FLAO|nr:hypothetical protein [Christiangramia flava]APU66807.1 hypothetical protein GRFL_0083 [Christiangramia flava JLT2011]OSS38444.1 hypothetical protein C723_2681 [Christiangramia flava JLT2011]
MVGGIFLILFLAVINQAIFNGFAKKHQFFSKKLMNNLYLYHIFFQIVYYTYASFNASDSKLYYSRPQNNTKSWSEFFGTSTTFVDFISYPFINYLHFNYEMMMILFGWLGFLGFLFAYLFFRENIPIKVNVFKNIDFLSLILFLPNMHFWTASLGKGSIIFFGLMMFAYAIKYPGKRLIRLILAGAVIYFVRPHVLLFVGFGTLLGYMSGREKIAFWKKLLVYIGMIGGLVLAQEQILAMAGMQNTDNFVENFENFSEDRADDLSKSGSGVDMTSYPLPIKLFTFWFRPLFLDAPGVLGLIVSIENFIYLLLFVKILNKRFWKFIKKSPITVKMSATVFFTSSLALVFVMSNLGIIMRQKSQVMYFLFFVIYYFLAEEKYKKIVKIKKLRNLQAKEEQLITT